MWQRLWIAWACVVALVFAGGTASAASGALVKPHQGNFEFSAALNICAFGLPTAESHSGNRAFPTALASDVPDAARGGAQSAANAAKLRVQLAADHILNAQRVGSGLKADAAHRSASFVTRAELEAGQVFGIRGGDGVQRTLLQTQGGMNGQNGIFEFIIDSGGAISHQRFIPGGAITGFPNQVVTRLP
jgi:hypothetical protein